jgi:hypothetical protein
MASFGNVYSVDQLKTLCTVSIDRLDIIIKLLSPRLEEYQGYNMLLTLPSLVIEI